MLAHAGAFGQAGVPLERRLGQSGTQLGVRGRYVTLVNYGTGSVVQGRAAAQPPRVLRPCGSAGGSEPSVGASVGGG